ncbi:MAG: DUF934 domain-containing protein [Alphaproteobacteria bacterium]|nr:DUF934 domain-containing protein [Alphaproteobacteria bacterium]
MPLLKGGVEVADGWRALADAEPVPAQGDVVVPLARFLAEREALLARGGKLGVRCRNTDAVEVLAPDLHRIDLIALEFPRFGDGRAFTQARVLRQRLGFQGELRATGEVLADQLLHMGRCGFDAFAAALPDLVAEWRKAGASYRAYYQPATADQAPLIAALRGGRRTPLANP